MRFSCCGVQVLDGGLSGVILEPLVKLYLVLNESRVAALAPGGAALQPAAQFSLCADQGQEVKASKIARFNAVKQVFWDAQTCPEQHHGPPGLVDVLAHPQPGFEKGPIALTGLVEGRHPQDVAVEGDGLLQVHRRHQAANSRFSRPAGARHHQKGEALEGLARPAFRADRIRAFRVDDFVSAVLAASRADVEHIGNPLRSAMCSTLIITILSRPRAVRWPQAWFSL
jgi:hypothetical protein